MRLGAPAGPSMRLSAPRFLLQAWRAARPGCSLSPRPCPFEDSLRRTRTLKAGRNGQALRDPVFPRPGNFLSTASTSRRVKDERPDLCPWSNLPSSFVVCENWAPPQGCEDSPCPWGITHTLAREDVCQLPTRPVVWNKHMSEEALSVESDEICKHLT